MKKVTIVIIIIVFLVFLFPDKVPCGLPGATCGFIDSENSEYKVIYEVQPYGITLREKVMRKRSPIFYKSYYLTTKL